MKRTQIYLEENLYQDLRVGAKISGISVSEYIRKLLSREIYLEKFNIPSVVKSLKKKGLSNIAKKAVPFGISDLAQNFDFYLEKSLK